MNHFDAVCCSHCFGTLLPKPLLFHNMRFLSSLFFCQGGPVFVQVPEPFQPFKNNEPVKIQVVVESNPKPAVSWHLNGKELTAKDGAQIVKDLANNTYSLTILKLNSLTHNGTITIKASNAVGNSTHQVNLVILGYFSFLFILCDN